MKWVLCNTRDWLYGVSFIVKSLKIVFNNIDGLLQERRNSSALAIELRLSYNYPSICHSEICQPLEHFMNRYVSVYWKFISTCDIVRYFCSKVNTWNVNCAFIYDSRTGVLVKVSKFFRQKNVSTWDSNPQSFGFMPNALTMWAIRARHLLSHVYIYDILREYVIFMHSKYMSTGSVKWKPF